MANIDFDETVDTYWDCECDENYIHKKTDTIKCNQCGTVEEDQPDSRIREVLIMLVQDSVSHNIRDFLGQVIKQRRK